jgi:DNA-directed RNA polymerase specialized sigma subunit
MGDMERAIAKPSSFIEQMMMTHGDPASADHNWEHIEIVSEAINKLDESEKFLIELRFFHRYSYSQITALMGYSSKSVAWYNVRDAMLALRERLLENEEMRDKFG